MNQKLHFKTHIPSKKNSKISCHQIIKNNLVVIWWFNGNQKCQQIHHGQLKFITIIWWWLNLIGVIEWWMNSIGTQLRQPKGFRSLSPYGNQKPFNPHNVFPPPLTPTFFIPSSLSPLNGDQNPFGYHVMWSLHKKTKVTNGNPLGI